MTTTTLPLDKISEAFDVLQEHGIIDDNLADHELGCWLEKNDLTCDDLNNYQPERATDSEMSELIACYERLFETDPREAIIELAYVRTSGARRDEVLEYTQEFKQQIAEMDGAEEEAD